MQYLGAGETETLVFLVKSEDETASQTVTITITGVNDEAVITVDAGNGDSDVGGVTEDATTPTLSGVSTV